MNGETDCECNIAASGSQVVREALGFTWLLVVHRKLDESEHRLALAESATISCMCQYEQEWV